MKVDLPIIRSRFYKLAPHINRVSPESPFFPMKHCRTLSKNESFFKSLRNQFIANQRISKIADKYSDTKDKVYILSGSSGVGKDTILKAFLDKHPEFHLSVSCTTRPIRNGEKDGIDYNFLTEKEFAEGIRNGDFFEWAEFSGNKYGTKKQSIEDSLDKHEKIILKLDTKGALKVKKLLPNAVLVFVAPPSLEELEARLRGRKTEDENSIKKRLSVIKSEMANSRLYDYTIVNDTVENAVKALEKIFKCNNAEGKEL